MALSDILLPEFDQEMAKTRKTLERVPEDKFGWRPHEKSGTMGWLAIHLALLPSLVGPIFGQDSLDFAPPGGQPFKMPAAESRKQILELFDKNVATARAAIAGAKDDSQLGKPWTLLSGGKTIFTMPKIAALRGMFMNHSIHHRAQLGVYLRMNNVPDRKSVV